MNFFSKAAIATILITLLISCRTLTKLWKLIRTTLLLPGLPEHASGTVHDLDNGDHTFLWYIFHKI